MKRYYILFIGQVQGVGFRYTTKILCDKYHITGDVKNMDDGSVIAHMQGKKEDILKVIQILKNDSFIRIKDYHMKELTIITDENYFKILV